MMWWFHFEIYFLPRAPRCPHPLPGVLLHQRRVLHLHCGVRLGDAPLHCAPAPLGPRHPNLIDRIMQYSLAHDGGLMMQNSTNVDQHFFRLDVYFPIFLVVGFHFFRYCNSEVHIESQGIASGHYLPSIWHVSIMCVQT